MSISYSALLHKSNMQNVCAKNIFPQFTVTKAHAITVCACVYLLCAIQLAIELAKQEETWITDCQESVSKPIVV